MTLFFVIHTFVFLFMSLALRLCEPCMLDPECGFCYRENGSALFASSCVPVNKASTERAAWGRWVTARWASTCARSEFRVDVIQDYLVEWDSSVHFLNFQYLVISSLKWAANDERLPLPGVPTPAWWKIRPTGPTITVPPHTRGWFYWVWCFTWLPLLQVAKGILWNHHVFIFWICLTLMLSMDISNYRIKVIKTSSSCLVSLRDGSHAMDHQLRDLPLVGQEHRKRLRCGGELDLQHPGVPNIPPPGSVFHLLWSVSEQTN